MKKLPVPNLLRALAAGFASAAFAAPPQPGPLEGSMLDETVIVGKRTDRTGETLAASQNTASGDEIRARPLLRRGEVLETIPGMVVTQHAGGGKANQYFLRGWNLDHGTDFATSLEGMPLNMRTHAHGQGYTDLNIIIPELIERVDYFKGTYAAQNGDLSSAGSADFKYYDTLPNGFATLEVGSYHYWRTALGNTFKIGEGEKGARLTIAGEYNYYDGPWTLAEQYSRWNGFARYASGDASDGFSLTLMGYRGKWRSTDQIPERAVASGQIDRFGFVDPTDGGNSSRYSLQFHWQKDDGQALTKLNLYGVYYALDLFSNFTYALDNPVNGDQFEQAEKRYIIGGDLSRTWEKRQFLGHESSFTLGLQTRTDFIDGIGLYNTEQRVRINTVREDDVIESSVGVFGESTIRWTPWLRTVAGLRADAFYYDVSANTAGNSGDQFAAIISPKITAILGPWKKTELYLNFGTGFHSNDARGVNTTRDPDTGATVSQVDPLVRTIGSEIGIRTQIIPKVTATLAAWWLDSDSELTYVGDAGTNEAGPGSRRYGIEAAIYWAPKDWLTFDSEVAFTHSRYRDSPGADRITDSVPWMFSGGFTIGAQGRQPGWFGGMRVRAFGPRPLTEDGSQEGRTTCTVNANVGYRTRRWETVLECTNLFNRYDNDIEYYYTSLLSYESGTGIDDTHFHPAEPRMFRGRVTYRW
jgi:outer membrane receptor protein involved in Fe transport